MGELLAIENILAELQDCLDDDNLDEVCGKLSFLHPAEIAQLLTIIDSKNRISLWQKIDDTTKGDILKELNEEIVVQLIATMDNAQLVGSIEQLDIDDLADIIPSLPESAVHNLLLTLDNKHRENLKKVLKYSENTAGGLMNTDIITVRSDVNVRTVIRYLRLLKQMPKDTDQIFVVDRAYKYLGSVATSNLISSAPDSLIENLLNQSPTKPINANVDEAEVANLFEQRDLISAPVIDDDNQLIGRITIDDVVDVIREAAEKSVKSMAGVGEEELFSPVLKSTKNRAIWLGINLITAFIAVFFIGLFEATLEKKIALAVLMPIVASMGGIAGTQSLILITRGIATNAVGFANIKILLNKEILVALLNSVLWGIVIAIATYLWFNDIVLSVIIASAIIINIISAAIFGALLPFILSRLKIDPALAGGVILTTITDVIGFTSFLGLASLFL